MADFRATSYTCFRRAIYICYEVFRRGVSVAPRPYTFQSFSCPRARSPDRVQYPSSAQQIIASRPPAVFAKVSRNLSPLSWRRFSGHRELTEGGVENGAELTDQSIRPLSPSLPSAIHSIHLVNQRCAPSQTSSRILLHVSFSV